MLIAALLTRSLLAAPSQEPSPEGITVTLRVVDAQGDPIAGALLGDMWSYADPELGEGEVPLLAEHEEQRWKRAFPFPIVLDPSGETADRYGVRGYPTTVLIGPDGKVLATDGGLEELRERLTTEHD